MVMHDVLYMVGKVNQQSGLCHQTLQGGNKQAPQTVLTCKTVMAAAAEAPNTPGAKHWFHRLQQQTDSTCPQSGHRPSPLHTTPRGQRCALSNNPGA